MADPEQVELLLGSVDEWNRWRRNGPDRPDLSGSVLYKANLVGADLHQCNLASANLMEADLRGATLAEANVQNATLRLARLVEAQLTDANLNGADLFGASLSLATLFATSLRRADLRETHLTCANFIGADLSDSNFLGANLAFTVFFSTDLTGVRGLELCEHSAPSMVDYDTLSRSADLPLPFLRGCGVPDTIIDILPALRGAAIAHYSCFISHSSRDSSFVQRLYADLQNRGVRCWLSSEHLKAGDRFRRAIFDAIRTREKLLLVLSKNSIASEWVESEVEEALQQEREQSRDILVPIRIDGAITKEPSAWARHIRNTRHIGDFTRWRTPEVYEQRLERLMRDLGKGSSSDVGE